MEKTVQSCFIPDCNNTSSHKALYPFLIDTNDINSWLVGVGSPELIENVPENHIRVCEQYFLCTDHMNFLESIRDVEKIEKDGDNHEENNEDHEVEEESAPDQLSQQLSTLSVSQPRTQEPDDDLDDAGVIEVLGEEKSQDFIELKNFCSQDLDSIFPPLPEDSTNVCRLCGKSTEDSIQIFSEENEGSEISLLEKIRYYLPIEIEEDDTLPKIICQVCNQLLNKLHDLAMTSLATEALLTGSITEEKLMQDKNEITEAREIMTVASEQQITSTQLEDKNDLVRCSQETVSDVIDFQCSQSSLITNDDDDDDEGPYTRFEGLKHLGTCGKKRPLTQENEDEAATKKRREEPIFETWYKCNMCTASSTDEEIIQFHKNRHRLNRPVLFWCNFCATEFSKESTFGNHVLSVHGDESKALSQAYTCNICHRVFSLKSTALIHFLVKCAVHPIQEYSTKNCAEEVYIRYAYVCEFCWRAFSFVSSLNEHRNQQHSNKYPWNGQMCIDEKEKRERIMDIFGIKTAFACKFCAHIFISFDNYIYHLKEHSDGLFKCTTCDKMLPSYEDFKQHRETKHDYRIVFREMTRENITSSIPFEEKLEETKPETSMIFQAIMGRLFPHQAS